MERISLLYLLSYSFLLLVGALSATLANAALGAILFFLGLVLLVGDEYAKSRQRARAGPVAQGLSSEISGMVAFSLVACAASLSAAFLLSSFYGWDARMLSLAFSGLAASAAKVASSTMTLFFAK